MPVNAAGLNETVLDVARIRLPWATHVCARTVHICAGTVHICAGTACLLGDRIRTCVQALRARCGCARAPGRATVR